LDTKLKKSKPWTAWLSFFMAVNIIGLLFLSSLGIFLYSEGSFDLLKAPFQDYQESRAFKERTGLYFSDLLDLLANSDLQNTGYQQAIQKRLNNEGSNLIYVAVNENTGLMLQSDNEVPTLLTSYTNPLLPAGYNYCWYFDGEKVRVFENGKQVDTRRLDSGYHRIIPHINIYTDNPDELANSRIVLGVRDDLQANPYGHSLYYRDQLLLSAIGWVSIGLGILGILLLVYAIMRWKDKRRFDHILASWVKGTWLEIKLLVALFIFTVLGMVAFNISSNSDDIFGLTIMTVVNSVVLLIFFWWFYILLADLLINRRRFFTHNIINTIIKAVTKSYLQYENKHPWQQRMLKRVYALVAAEAVLAFTAVCFVLVSLSGSIGFFLIAVLITGTGIYLLYRYLQRFNQTVTDLGALIDQLKLIKGGDMETRLELPEDSDMYRAAQNLNSIQEGMSKAVADKLKSERLKIDLITNVSHDLKTPLTSIISYVDLLAQEKNLPEHVNDYITILAQKSERLKNLIQDLFDLSKASSATIALELEQIDLVRLINQTLADLDEQIIESGLTFRINIPDEPVFIWADGKRLYRVWENLIANALKYSLTGSRVFIDLTSDGKECLAAIKNTANYEMTFTEDEIMQRFVRGDEARSTEGSGLGLSIAQTFTEICGGSFAITIDGDLFKVELRFPIYSEENKNL
jgi:signal transduction histidine kinase